MKRAYEPILHMDRSQKARPNRENLSDALGIQMEVLLKIEGIPLERANSMRYSILIGTMTSQTLKSAAFSCRILSMNALKAVPVMMLMLGRLA